MTKHNIIWGLTYIRIYLFIHNIKNTV